MIDAIKEAAALLRDPHGRDPESMARVAGELESLVANAAIVVGFGREEAVSLVRGANLLHDSLLDALGAEVEQMLRDHPERAMRVAPLARAAMALELALVQEGVEL